MDDHHIFYQRVKLLAIMMNAVGKGFPMEDHRKMAMQNNIDAICETMKFNAEKKMNTLKVA